MVPSVEFNIALGGYNDRSAHPEGLQNRALLTFVITPGRCTTDAKAGHAKSSTYGAKFDLLCKILQQSVPHPRHDSRRGANSKLGWIARKPMTINDKQHGTRQTGFGGGGRLMAHQLHFLLVWLATPRSVC
jgi:hypothetical protein